MIPLDHRTKLCHKKDMRKNFSYKRLQPIGEILRTSLKKRGMAVRLEENTFVKLWPKAVGEKIAHQTQPDGWRAGTLFIKTTSSVWVQQLHFMKEDIRQKVNELAGKELVKDIHFTVGYKPASSRTGRHLPDSKEIHLKDRDTRMITECTRSINDPELATIIKRVMKLEIGRRRQLENRRSRS